MGDERFERLSEGQKACLRLFHAHYQIKEIATELGIHPSSVNERLQRARRTLGANNSNEAARMLAEYEQRRGVWIPPTGSANPVPPEASPAADDPATTVDAPLDEHLADSGLLTPHPVRSEPATTSRLAWPFPTRGRNENDLSSIARVVWVVPCAALALIAMLLIAVLTIGLQDVLTELPQSLKRLL